MTTVPPRPERTRPGQPPAPGQPEQPQPEPEQPDDQPERDDDPENPLNRPEPEPSDQVVGVVTSTATTPAEG